MLTTFFTATIVFRIHPLPLSPVSRGVGNRASSLLSLDLRALSSRGKELSNPDAHKEHSLMSFEKFIKNYALTFEEFNKCNEVFKQSRKVTPGLMTDEKAYDDYLRIFYQSYKDNIR